MTDEERFGLIQSLMVMVLKPDFSSERDARIPENIPQIAGWVKGVPRLGIPDLLLTDAGMGITNPGSGRKGDQATAFPSAQALAATFNPKLAYEAGAILGKEAKSRGFNVVLGGGINLARDPRHGRNFEYFSEDPWLSAVMAAETVKGTQDQKVMGILKHASLNSQEINKWFLDARIDPAAHRESELLGFQVAIERSRPGSIMCAYNKVNGEYTCGNDTLLNQQIKKDMDYKGFIMSDWKAVYNWDFALKGLDQHSGIQLDEKEWFGLPLQQALKNGQFPRERLSDMVQRILYAIYSTGVDQWHGAQAQPDLKAHIASTVEVARQGTVLLKNNNLLPIPSDVKKIAIIGGFSNQGMISGGGGSSLVDPIGGFAMNIPLGGNNMFAPLRRLAITGPSPLNELRKQFPHAEFLTDAGETPAESAAIAKRADIAIIFAYKTEAENHDHADLSLPWGQDQLIQAVSTANPKTVVVLQTGNPVTMPWHKQVPAIIESWYSGNAGGTAIAEILSGKVNPSGRLPVTFYADIHQTPHPELPGFGTPADTPTTINYHEGAEIGYRWMAKTHAKPLFSFGHGLSYTQFSYSNLKLSGGNTVTAQFTIKNTGQRDGAEIPQLYLVNAPDGQRMRLLGFDRIQLKAGESRKVTISADPRLLSKYDALNSHWKIAGGSYTISVGKSANDLTLTSQVNLNTRTFGK
nr:glycoside hydrolase family 3 C-terminal domain-containing protein [Acinetobacter sp. Marseille-Q1620]